MGTCFCSEVDEHDIDWLEMDRDLLDAIVSCEARKKKKKRKRKKKKKKKQKTF